MRWGGFWGGLALCVLLLLLPHPAELPDPALRVAALALLMGIWWFTEAVPVAITGLLPFIALPALGVAKPEAVAASYMSPVLFLVLGGTLMGVAVERWDLHRRVARAVLQRAGTSSTSLVGTVLTATAVVSMWVNNSAATVMMLPIALALIHAVTAPAALGGDRAAPLPEPQRRFAAAMVLAVAYGSNIGGFATLVGTPVNAAAAALIRQQLGVQLGFLQWLAFGLPLMLLALPVCLWLLTAVAFPCRLAPVPRSQLLAAVGDPGGWTAAQRRVVSVISLCSVAWVAMPWLEKRIPGCNDASVAVLGALLLCVLPSGERTTAAAARSLIGWQEAARAPWYLLVLLGGGLALAEAVTRSGLGGWLGQELTLLAVLPLWVLLPVVVLVVILLTEGASNLATAAAFIPVSIALAQGGGHSPQVFALATGLAASWGFANPAGTSSNALVYGTGFLRSTEMIRAGLLFDLAGVVLISAISLWALP